jgi:hypothetical protein
VLRILIVKSLLKKSFKISQNRYNPTKSFKFFKIFFVKIIFQNLNPIHTNSTSNIFLYDMIVLFCYILIYHIINHTLAIYTIYNWMIVSCVNAHEKSLVN